MPSVLPEMPAKRSASTTVAKGPATRPAHPITTHVFVITVVLAVLFGAMAGFVAGFAASSDAIHRKIVAAMPAGMRAAFEDVRDATPSPLAVAKNEERATIGAVLRASPAVVSIVAEKEVAALPAEADPFADEYLRRFLEDFGYEFVPGEPLPEGEEGEIQRMSSGTGFFVREDGYIVTNRHVVADEEAAYRVVMADGTEHAATVLARDAVNDIAVLKVDGEGFPSVVLGDSDHAKVGQSVIAIGYALGRFGNTVSRGIVSGLQRSISAGDGFGPTEELYDVIQTDAAINPGNSGGPLLDLDGNVIGMNVAIVGGAQNIGFAIPINDVRLVLESVQQTGRISRPMLGVRYVTIDARVRKEAGLDASVDGALVSGGERPGEEAVVEGSPAAVAGIKDGDIITMVDGEVLSEEFPLAVAIRKHHVGDTVAVTLSRDGESLEVQVTLAERE